MTKRTERILLFALLAAFILINLAFLTRFPFVHSDETWLAGLTRNMLKQRSLAITEPFFDLKPRRPHALKSLFHLMQMPFLLLGGYGIFSVRLLSLLGGALTLAAFYRAAKRLAKPAAALAAATLHACDVQLIAASHLARQEIWLCFVLSICLGNLLKDNAPSWQNVLLLAALTGLSAGLHPNAFIIAAMCGAVLFSRLVLLREGSVRLLLAYVTITGAVAGLFAAASERMQSGFFPGYFAYGAGEFEISASLFERVTELPRYLQKLWQGTSVTYYVPNLKPQFIIFLLLLVGAFARAWCDRLVHPRRFRQLVTLLSAIAGILAGIAIIGRYGQPGAVLLAPVLWLLAAALCQAAEGRHSICAAAVICCVLLASTVQQVRPWLAYSYEDYLDNLAQFVPSDSKTIANLNTGFHFENGALLDYRNLPYLKESGKSFAEYVRENQVEYIVVSDELDFIYSLRPKWNMVYGNPMFLEQVRAFTQSHCEQVGYFTDPIYGARIIELLNGAHPDFGFGVTVWRVKDPQQDVG